METKNWKKTIDSIIRKNYRSLDFSAARLAEMLEVDNYKLSRIFRQTYGQTYPDVIHPYRVKAAQKLLLNPKMSNLTMEEIGLLSGFHNRWSFYHVFRKYTGTTPTEWREKMKKEMN